MNVLTYLHGLGAINWCKLCIAVVRFHSRRPTEGVISTDVGYRFTRWRCCMPFDSTGRWPISIIPIIGDDIFLFSPYWLPKAPFIVASMPCHKKVDSYWRKLGWRLGLVVSEVRLADGKAHRFRCWRCSNSSHQCLLDTSQCYSCHIYTMKTLQATAHSHYDLHAVDITTVLYSFPWDCRLLDFVSPDNVVIIIIITIAFFAVNSQS